MKKDIRGAISYTIESDIGVFDLHPSIEQLTDGLEIIKIDLKAESAHVPPEIKIMWDFPCIDIKGMWHPKADFNKSLMLNFFGDYMSNATVSAPVICLYGDNDRNRHTFAISDALNVVKFHAGVREEDASIECRVKLFSEPVEPVKIARVQIRVDFRPVPYEQAIAEVGSWWASIPEYMPSDVPDSCCHPMYSTWYSFHQTVSAQGIERQADLATGTGCKSIIVDDGWQSDVTDRTYANCGDWEASAKKFPNMREHIDKIHALGMKYLLWYATPFVGYNSKAWNRFSGKMLYSIDGVKTGVLDPRYPEVREYVIDFLKKALINWGVDGFKLDFIDCFYHQEQDNNAQDPLRDYCSPSQAANRLLDDLYHELHQINPDIMIEFRRSYIGPLMRKYCNIFRAGDCANNMLFNKFQIVDIRLLCGKTAVHSDMIVWNQQEKPQQAARHLIHALFSTPQISVAFDQLPASHQQVIKFWLGKWEEYREAFLFGSLRAIAPDLLYPVVTALTDHQFVAGVYADMPVDFPENIPPRSLIANGSHHERVYFRFSHACKEGLKSQMRNYTLTIWDCVGNVVARCNFVTPQNSELTEINIPAGGAAELISD